MSGLSRDQAVALSRAAVLFHSEAAALSTFEAELVEACVDRYRRNGAAAAMTLHEWAVVQDAIAAMSVARDQRRETAEERRGAA